jgi:hypothetical protein
MCTSTRVIREHQDNGQICEREQGNSLINHYSLCTSFAEVFLRERINPVVSIADVLVAASLL